MLLQFYANNRNFLQGCRRTILTLGLCGTSMILPNTTFLHAGLSGFTMARAARKPGMRTFPSFSKLSMTTSCIAFKMDSTCFLSTPATPDTCATKDLIFEPKMAASSLNTPRATVSHHPFGGPLHTTAHYEKGGRFQETYRSRVVRTPSREYDDRCSRQCFVSCSLQHAGEGKG